MEIAKGHLDIPISQLVEGATNTETLREFIRNTEKEFMIQPADLEALTQKELNNYVSVLDELRNK